MSPKGEPTTSGASRWTESPILYGAVYAVGFGLWELLDGLGGVAPLRLELVLGAMTVGFLIGYTVHLKWDVWVRWFTRRGNG